MGRILCLFMLLTTAASVVRAENFQADGLYYTITADNTVMLVSETDASGGGSTIGIGFSGGYEGDVVIPATVEHNSVTYTVTAVKPGVFAASTKLTSVTIPATVLTLGGSPFAACERLTAVVVDEENPVYCSIDGVLYNKEQTRIITCPATRTGSFNIPQTVTHIARSAFYGCKNLTDITIPEGVDSIGVYAFRGCTNLLSAVIPEGVRVISMGAFQECRHLSTLVLPSSVTRVEEQAFYYCQSLKTIHLPGQVNYIGDGAFRNCSSLTECTIPEGVDSIGDYAFAICPQLETLHLPASLVYFGAGVIMTSGKVSEITVDAANEYYQSQDGILYDKDLTTLIVCPCGKTGAVSVAPMATDIADLAFATCMGVTDIHLPVSVRRIGYGAFSGCYRLERLTIPNSVEEIGQNAFTSCSSLTRVTNYVCPVTAIPASAFSTVTFDNVPLYVPARYLSQYKKAEGWKYFKTVLPIVENVTASTGEAYTPALFDITIDMVNAEAGLQSCEMELVLPEGFQLLEYENGVAGFTFGERLQGNTPEMSFTHTTEDTYILHIDFGNTTGNIGNEGTVLTLRGLADAGMTAGDYEGQIRNVSLTYAGDYATTPENSVFEIHLQEALPGDVNRDGIVNITDVMLCANYAVGQNVSTFVRPLADMNNDTQISITDIMQIVNIVVSGE